MTTTITTITTITVIIQSSANAPLVRPGAGRHALDPHRGSLVRPGFSRAPLIAPLLLLSALVPWFFRTLPHEHRPTPRDAVAACL